MDHDLDVVAFHVVGFKARGISNESLGSASLLCRKAIFLLLGIHRRVGVAVNSLVFTSLNHFVIRIMK